MSATYVALAIRDVECGMFEGEQTITLLSDDVECPLTTTAIDVTTERLDEWCYALTPIESWRSTVQAHREFARGTVPELTSANDDAATVADVEWWRIADLRDTTVTLGVTHTADLVIRRLGAWTGAYGPTCAPSATLVDAPRRFAIDAFANAILGQGDQGTRSDGTQPSGWVLLPATVTDAR